MIHLASTAVRGLVTKCLYLETMQKYHSIQTKVIKEEDF